MFDNCDVAWVHNLPTTIPTVGHMLRAAGYYTAWKGKWHLNREFDTHEPERFFTKEMEAYGFSDYVSPGDLIAHTLGGYEFDHLIAGSAVSWLRRIGRPLSSQGKPWSLFVSLVNPHDIMYFNTDAPGQPVQLRFTALNRRTTPALNGKLLQVSADRLTDARSGNSFYQLRASIDPDQPALETLKLYPGMPVEVIVLTGQRSLFDYVAKPLTDSLGRALREH